MNIWQSLSKNKKAKMNFFFIYLIFFPFYCFCQQNKNDAKDHVIGIKTVINFANIINASSINSSQTGFHVGAFFAPPSKSLFGYYMADPSMMIKLYRFTSAKGNREAVLSSQPGTFGKAKSSDNEIACSVQKSGSDTYILIPDTKLAPGEYGS